jgi:hypothetical protein
MGETQNKEDHYICGCDLELTRQILVTETVVAVIKAPVLLYLFRKNNVY